MARNTGTLLSIVFNLILFCQAQPAFNVMLRERADHENRELIFDPKNGQELVHSNAFKSQHAKVKVVLLPDTVYEINENIVPKGPQHLIINGAGSTVYCIEDVGFTFQDLKISIDNLTITSCGARHKSQNNNIEFKSAVYTRNSSSVVLKEVTITNSSGVGLSLINCHRSVKIHFSNFENNCGDDNGTVGGGGVYIEQIKSSVSFEILSTKFIGNNASTGNYTPENYPLYVNSTDPFLFGRGGGLSINLNDTSAVEVQIKNCSFQNNTSHRGGGLFVFFLKNTINNSIQITDTNFTHNKCTIPQTIYTAGGGLALFYHSDTSCNQCDVSRCHFHENRAYYGGGISVGTNNDRIKDSSFLIKDSSLVTNSARIGSAMDLFCYSIIASTHCQRIIGLEIRNSRFVNNNGTFNMEQTFATIHLEGLVAQLTENVTISENQASAIVLERAVLEIISGAEVLISNNTAQVGGGIALMGGSEIHLHNGIGLSLISNMATNKGGGLYAELTQHFFSIYSHTCFMRCFNSSKFNCDDNMTVHVYFSRNTANGRGNDIFASSLYPCLEQKNSIADTFCKWNGWNFDTDGNCTDLIQTLPSSFSCKNYTVKVFPSIPTEVKGFVAKDDLGHDVTNQTIFTTCLLNEKRAKKDIKEPEMTGNLITVIGESGQHKVLVQTAYHRSISTMLNVTILDCPAGYTLVNERCACDIRNLASLHCGPDNKSLLYTVSIFIGNCAGYGNISDKEALIVSKCPFTANNLIMPLVSFQKKEFNQKFCSKFNRTQLLCQKCIDNYGIDIFSPVYQCRPCNSSYINWIKAIGVVIGPQTLFFLFVFVFHVGITAPSMTGYIFFSHVVTMPLETLLIQSAWTLDLNDEHTANILTNIMMGPYRVWSFDYPEIFQVKVCLYESLRIMHAIAFRYIHALYPIMLVAVTLLLIELHARNCKPVVYLWKPLCFLCVRLRRKWEVKTSVIDAFATVILLSYSKVVNTSLYLLTRNYVRNSHGEHIETRLDYDTSVVYFEGQHVVLAGVAILILCTFGTIPPLLLLLYPSQWFFKFLTKVKLDGWHGLHVFVETFQGSFKNRADGSPERRWFAGVYFLFRIIVFVVFAVSDELVQLHFHLAITYTVFLLLMVILKPYKNNFYTYLDASFMGILILINCSVVYCVTYIQVRRNIGYLPKAVWHFTYLMMWVPTLYLVVYVFYLVCTRSRSTFIQRYCVSNLRHLRNRTVTLFSTTSPEQERLLSVSGDNYFNDSVPSDQPTHSSLGSFCDVPDRVDNPQRYFNMEQSSSCQLNGASYSVVSVDKEKDREELRSQNLHNN